MSSQIEQTFATPAGKYLVDTYEDWARAEGVPIHTGAVLDLETLETKEWPRFGLRGAFCHVDGHCDFLTMFLMELAPGASSAQQHHLYEEICYVLTGCGTTEIELGNGTNRLIEWGPGSLFAAPTNTRYRHRCVSSESARFAAVNDLRYLMNLYRNERFLFETPLGFPERGLGDVVYDLAKLHLDMEQRPHELTTSFALAEGSVGADLVELPTGTYGQARRQMFGSLLFGVAGAGMTSSWVEGEQSRTRINWRHGIVFAPAGLSFHQHFNIGPEPARFLRIELGSMTYPMLRPRKRAYGDTSVYASGNAEIEYADEFPDIRREWLAMLAKAGVPSRM